MSTVENICPKCGRVLRPEWRACPDCNWSLNKKRSSRSTAILSLVCCVIGIFFFAYLFGLLGIGLGLAAVKNKNKDKLGYVGIIFGVIIFIFGVINWFYSLTYWL